MAYNVAPPNGWPQLNINDVDVDTSALANKEDIATEFSDLTNYSAGDLVYYEGVLYEFQVDHTAGAWETSEVIQKDLSDVINTLSARVLEIKTTTYTGSGTTPHEISLPDDVHYILGIFRNDAGVCTSGYFPGQPIMHIFYTVPSQNDTSVLAAYDGEAKTLTLSSGDAGAVMNTTDKTYTIVYV